MIDVVKIYGKIKEQFGWFDEFLEEFFFVFVSNICFLNLNQSNGIGDSDLVVFIIISGIVLERYQYWQGLVLVFVIFYFFCRICVLRELVFNNCFQFSL